MADFGIGEAMMAVGLLGGATTAAGQYGSMQAQSANAAYQAQVAANNARIARQNAAMETQAGEIAAGTSEMKTRAAIGNTLATQGASGVDVNVGSSAKVRAGEAELGMLDALTIRSNAAKRAWAYKTQATDYTAESGLLSSQSSQAASAAPVAAFGTLLSSAATAGGSYARYVQAAPGAVPPPMDPNPASELWGVS